MVLYRPLRHLYPFYMQLRTHYIMPKYVMWGTTVLVFIQILLATIISVKPTKLFLIKEGTIFIQYLQVVVYFMPWVFGMESFWLEITLVLVVNIAVLVIVIICAFRVEKKKHVSFIFYVIIGNYQQIIPYVLIIPFCYRVSYLTQRYIQKGFATTIVGLVLILISFVFNFIHVFLNSLFLKPITLVRSSKLDVYDGKRLPHVFIIQNLFCLGLLLFPVISVQTVQVIVLIFLFILCFFLYYIRVMTTVHVDVLGQYFEIAPLYTIPIMLVFNAYTKNVSWIVNVILMICLHFVYICLFMMQKKILIRKALSIFSPFLHKDDTSEAIMQFIPGNLVSIIRILASYHPDPIAFERFIVVQKKAGIRNSHYLEVIRFLSIFPTRRADILTQIETITSKSNFNDFMIYAIKKELNALLQCSNNEKKQELINKLHRSYLLHQHLYWNARKNKKLFTVFFEAFTAAYYYIETKMTLAGFLKRYPFSAGLYQIKADFLLAAEGDFEGHKFYKEAASNLEYNSTDISDPVLHPMTMVNPRILQFCKEIEAMTEKSSTSVSSSIHYSSTCESSKNTHMAATNIGTKATSIASYLQISHRIVPLTTILHFLIPVIFFMIWIAQILPMEKLIQSKEPSLMSNLSTAINILYKATSSMFIPFALGQETNATGIAFIDNNDNGLDFKNETECLILFHQIPDMIRLYYQSIESIHTLSSFMMVLTYQTIATHFQQQGTICSLMDNMLSSVRNSSIDEMMKLVNLSYSIDSTVLYLESEANKRYNIVYFEVIGIFVFIATIVVSFIITFIQFNVILGKDKSIIDYFASQDRLYLLLFQRSEEAWNQLRSFFMFKDSHSDSSQIMSLNNSRSAFTSDAPTDSMPPSAPTPPPPPLVQSDDIDPSDSSSVITKNPIVKKAIHNSIHMNQDDQQQPAQGSQGSIQKSLSFSSQLTIPEEDGYRNSDDDRSDYAQKQQNDEDEIDITEDKEIWPFCAINIIPIIPWILMLFAIAVLMVPVEQKIANETIILDNIEKLEKHANVSISLLRFSFMQVLYNTNETQSYIRIIKKFDEYHTKISDIFDKIVCHEFVGGECSSIRQTVERLINHEENRMVSYVLPLFSDFTTQAFMSVLIPYVESIVEIPQSPGPCFIADIVIVLIIVLWIGLQTTLSLNEAFNSLYHFPSSLLFDKKKREEEAKKMAEMENQFMPYNVIVITSVPETDEIYSISDNSPNFLNRPCVDFICGKLNKFFPLASDHQVEMREYLMPDNKNKKLFRSISWKKDFLIKTLLVEEMMMAKPRNNKRTETLSTKLLYFMTPYFAKKYSDEKQINFDFPNPLFIQIRLKKSSEVPQLMFDKFFAICNSQLQNYTTMTMLRQNGRILSFVLESNTDPLIVMFFLRDLINDTKNLAKQKEDNYVIDAIFIDYVDEIKTSVNDKCEPFLEFEDFDIEKYELNAFNIPKGHISITEAAAERIPNTTALQKQTDQFFADYFNTI